MKALLRINLVAFVLLMVACSTGIIAVGKDTYMVSRRSAQAGYGPPLGAKAATYVEANDFCREMNKSIKTVELNMSDSGFARPGTVDLTFMCVD